MQDAVQEAEAIGDVGQRLFPLGEGSCWRLKTVGRFFIPSGNQLVKNKVDAISLMPLCSFSEAASSPPGCAANGFDHMTVTEFGLFVTPGVRVMQGGGSIWSLRASPGGGGTPWASGGGYARPRSTSPLMLLVSVLWAMRRPTRPRRGVCPGVSPDPTVSPGPLPPCSPLVAP